MKKVSTLTGSLFLLWLIGSPILGFTLYVKTDQLNPLLFILLSYVTLGLMGYFIAKKVVGRNKKLIENSEEPKAKKWTAIINYVIGTNILFFIFTFLAGIITLKLFGNSGLWIIYLAEYPLITLLAARLSLKRTRKLFQLSPDFSKKSIVLFIGLNLLFGIILQVIQKQFFFSWADLGIILAFLVFFSYTTNEFSHKDSSL